MKYIFIILTLSFNILANDCLNQKDEMGFKWASGPIRKQGGGWIWFTGKGKAPTSQLSEDISIGQALERFKQECKSINQKIRIHESCTEKEDETYTSYSRISIKDKHCKNGEEEENPTLIKKHKRYEKFISNQTSRLKNKTSALNNYYNKSNNQKFKDQMLGQINYLKRKIDNLKNIKNPFPLDFYNDKSEDFYNPSNIDISKYVIKIALAKPFKISRAKKDTILKKICKKGVPIACYAFIRNKANYDLKGISKDDIKLVEKSCLDGYGASCVWLGRWKSEFSRYYNIRSVIKELDKYCKTYSKVKTFDSENDDPCYSIRFFFKENQEKQLLYDKISCSKIGSSNTTFGNNLCLTYGDIRLNKMGSVFPKDKFEDALFFYKEACESYGQCKKYNKIKNVKCLFGKCINPYLTY